MRACEKSSKLCQSLEVQRKRLQNISLADLYDSDSARAKNFSLRLENLFFDYSRNFVERETLDALIALARSARLEEQRDAMVHGGLANESERRAAHHMALRSSSRTPLLSAWGQDERPTFFLARKGCKRFVEEWQRGNICNAQGEPLTDLLHVGIGGSEIGTRLLVESLQGLVPNKAGGGEAIRQRARLFFVSGFDGLEDLLRMARPPLDPRRCLVLLVSKSFRTEETLHNARALMRWMRPVHDSFTRHFVAITSAPEKVREALPSLLLSSDRIFPLSCDVGGRYSLWSAVSLSAELLLGTKVFERLLRGAEAMDEHFLNEPLESNMPVVMGLLSVWYRNFWGFSNHAVFPYDTRLRSAPAYLQQLAMESGGKNVHKNTHENTRSDGINISGGGSRIGRNTLSNTFSNTSALVWGGHGSSVQHSVFQWLHQGTESFSCDFWLAARGSDEASQARLVAHCLAQGEILMRGQGNNNRENNNRGDNGGGSVERYRILDGGHPSSLLLYSALDAYVLGMLLSLYEHRVFVEGVLWGTNPFDQWGVEGGKVVARRLLLEVLGERGGEDWDKYETRSLRDAMGSWRAIREYKKRR